MVARRKNGVLVFEDIILRRMGVPPRSCCSDPFPSQTKEAFSSFANSKDGIRSIVSGIFSKVEEEDPDVQLLSAVPPSPVTPTVIGK